MHIVRSMLRYIPGLLCLAMGSMQLAWVWWLVGNSFHMGSPLRLHGDMVIRSVLDPVAQGRVEYMYKVGLLGFDLLGYSMGLHFISGLVLAGLGAVLIVSALHKRKHLKGAH